MSSIEDLIFGGSSDELKKKKKRERERERDNGMLKG